jgi:threonine aldolase
MSARPIDDDAAFRRPDSAGRRPALSFADRWRLQQTCDRVLSSLPAQSPRQRLAMMAGLAGSYDLSGPPDLYGDGLVETLEGRVAELLGKPAAVFFPTGTMAQQVALRCLAERSGSPAVVLHPLSHLEMDERKAYSQLAGLRAVWPTRAPRQPTVEEIRAIDEPYGTLTLELPLRQPGFLLPTFAELTELTAAARERGAYVHFDGARLWETTSHFGRPLPTIAALADTVYVSFYKTLHGLSGAALAGPADLMAQARAWRHRYGGNLFQQWPAALTALAGLDTELPRLPSYVAHAKVVAQALSELPGVTVNPAPPHTHQFQLWLPGPAERLNEATLALAEGSGVWFCGRWHDEPPTGLAVTELTIAGGALEWTADDVRTVARLLL